MSSYQQPPNSPPQTRRTSFTEVSGMRRFSLPNSHPPNIVRPPHDKWRQRFHRHCLDRAQTERQRILQSSRGLADMMDMDDVEEENSIVTDDQEVIMTALETQRLQEMVRQEWQEWTSREFAMPHTAPATPDESFLRDISLEMRQQMMMGRGGADNGAIAAMTVRPSTSTPSSMQWREPHPDWE